MKLREGPILGGESRFFAHLGCIQAGEKYRQTAVVRGVGLIQNTQIASPPLCQDMSWWSIDGLLGAVDGAVEQLVA